MINDQAAGLGGKVVAGTVRDSLHMIDVLFNQDGGQRPDIVVSDTGSYSDLVFGLVTLLGVQYRPALADLPDRKGRRISQSAGDGPLNAFARGKIDLGRIRAHWHDILRVVVSIYTGEVRAHDVVRILQRDGHPTAGRGGDRLLRPHPQDTAHLHPGRRGALPARHQGHAQPAAGPGRPGRQDLLRQEGRAVPALPRGHGRPARRPGLILNRVVLWTTRYISAALRAQGYPVLDEDVARLSPFVREHVNVIGKYNFLGSRHHLAQKQRLGSRPVTRGRIAWFYCACRPCQIGVLRRGLLFGEGTPVATREVFSEDELAQLRGFPTLPVPS